MKIAIEGLDRLIKKTDPKILAKPLRDFFERTAITLEQRAKQNAPVDTGHLRAMIQHETDSQNPPRYTKVGLLGAETRTPLWFKARAMEFGTGSQGDPAVSHKASHFPPSGSLDLWASRRGFPNGFAVARAIAKRGGLRPRPWLRPALRDSARDIQVFLARLGRDLQSAWGKK